MGIEVQMKRRGDGWTMLDNMSEEKVFGRVTWRRMPSYIDNTQLRDTDEEEEENVCDGN